MTRIDVTPTVRRAVQVLWMAGVRTGEAWELLAAAELGDARDVPPAPAKRAVRLRLGEQPGEDIP